MQVREVQALIGKTASIKLDGLWVQVRILDIKYTWGRTRYLITPVAGGGEKWVENVSEIEGEGTA